MDKSRYEYQRVFGQQHYDRLYLALRKGQKDRIRKTVQAAGISINEYIALLISADQNRPEGSAVLQLHKFDAEQIRLLEAWQVPKKYFDMIERVAASKEGGYTIELKAGYINDESGSRIISAAATKEIRRIIVKSHAVTDPEAVNEYGHTKEEEKFLQVWQIPKKYHAAILHCFGNKESGYTIELRAGYINDRSGSRIITAGKANDIRSIIPATRKIKSLT